MTKDFLSSNERLAAALPTAEELAMLRGAYAETYPVRPLLNEIDRLREALRLIEENSHLVREPIASMKSIGLIARQSLGTADETPDAPVWDVPSGWRGQEPWFKVGDQVLPHVQICGLKPVCTVTEITERGFKYTHEKISMGPRYGWLNSGETYEPSGYYRRPDKTEPPLPIKPHCDHERVSQTLLGGKHAVNWATCLDCGAQWKC